MWQGRWAMMSFCGSVMVVVATIVTVYLLREGLRSSRALQRQEFQAYLTIFDLSVGAGESGMMYVQAKCENYGRTPAKMVDGTCRISFTVQERPGILNHVGGCGCEIRSDDVHPNHPRQIVFGDELDSEGSVQEALEKRGTAVVSLRLSYLDVFRRWHEVYEIHSYDVIPHPAGAGIFLRLAD